MNDQTRHDGADAAAAGQATPPTVSDPPPEEPTPEVPTTSRLSRRGFVLGLMAVVGGIAAALVAIPAGAFMSAPGWLSTLPRRLLSETVSPVLRSDEWSSAGAVDDFRLGIPKYVNVDRLVVDGWVKRVEPVGVYVLREGDAQATVLDPHCTHLGCPVSWSDGSGSFLCPCHGGAFDPEGYPKGGPPPRRMDVYETRVENGEIQLRTLLPSEPEG